MIVLIILLSCLFVGLFLSSDEYEELVYKNGGYFFSLGIFLLIATERALKQRNIKEELNKLPKESEVIISKSEQWQIFLHATLKRNYLFMIFGLIEIVMFFVIQNWTSRQIWELLYFGLAFLLLTGVVETVGFPLIRSNQGFPKSKMKYRILSDKIEINSNKMIKSVDIKDVRFTDVKGNLMLVQTLTDPKYLVFKLKNN